MFLFWLRLISISYFRVKTVVGLLAQKITNIHNRYSSGRLIETDKLIALHIYASTNGSLETEWVVIILLYSPVCLCYICIMYTHCNNNTIWDLQEFSSTCSMHFHKYLTEKRWNEFFFFFSFFSFRLTQHSCRTVKSAIIIATGGRRPSKGEREGERGIERRGGEEKKKWILWFVQEYLPILEIYPLWFGQPTQEFWYHHWDKKKK